MFASNNNLKSVISNGGGTFTFDGLPAQLTKGYMVSLSGFEITTPIAGLSESGFNRMANELVNKVGDLADPATHFIGSWVDNGEIYVDLSVRIDDLDAALVAASSANQLAIYDIANQKDIRL